MEYIDELLVAIDEQFSYILVGSIFMFAALFIFRKIMSMFLFVVFGIFLFAVVKLTVLQPNATGGTTEGIIKQRMNSVQEAIDEVKKIKESMQEKVDGAKETREKIDKTINKFKEKEKSEFDKFMQELEKEQKKSDFDLFMQELEKE